MTLTTLATLAGTLAGTLAKTLAKTLGRCQNAAGDAVPFTIPLDERHLGVTETLRACSPPSYYMDRKDLLLLLLVYRRRTRRAREASRRRRRKWVRTIFQRRREHGDYHNLLAEMRLQDAESHYRFLRMSRETFDALVAKVAPALKRRSYQSVYRPEISPGERLALTLRYLATGNSQVSVSFSFRVGRATVCHIIRETCAALWQVLQPEYVKGPSSEEDWKGIAREFSKLWNFPNCVGAIDGKHISIQAPASSGSSYYNYKGGHSVVLMAVCDAHYRFIFVDIGNSGRHSDGGVLSNSEFGRALDAGKLGLPSPTTLPGTAIEVPFAFVGDEAFPLQRNMLRPYPGRNLADPEAVFNYRLSRSRRVIENSFGILAARWRLFRRPIIASPDHVVLFTQAAIALHNYLRTTESTVYCPRGFSDAEDGAGNVTEGAWRSEVDGDNGLSRIGSVGSNMYSRSAATCRDTIRDYFMSSEGEVTWQYHHIHRTEY